MWDMKLKNMNASWQDIYSVVNTAEYESYEKALNSKHNKSQLSQKEI